MRDAPSRDPGRRRRPRCRVRQHGTNDSQVWFNDGLGTFHDSGQKLTQQGHGPGLGDLDVVEAGFQGKAEVWLNQTPLPYAAQGHGLYLGQTPPGLDVELFAPGIVSIEEGKEYKITVAPDLQEILFRRRTPGGRDDRLWYSRLENGKLTMPEPAPCTYAAFETDACFTPDGSRLYFESARPLPDAEAASRQPNVWFVDRTETGWSEPALTSSWCSF